MNINQHFPWLLFIGSAILLTAGLHHYNSSSRNVLFATEKAQKRDITSTVKAQGILVPEDIIKIGNLVNGIITAMYLQENDFVQEGQLLARIEDGKQDKEIDAAFGNLDAAQAVLNYQLELLKRQQQLFAAKQVSLDVYQQAERDYQAAYAKVEAAKGLYEEAKLTFDYKCVTSPVSGIVIAKNVSVGEAVSNFSPASVIYAIAKNTKQLKAHIFLDDSTTPIVETNMPTHIVTHTHPHKAFTGAVTEVTNTPHVMELSDYTYARLIPSTTKPAHHCAIVQVDNSNLSLRPGMTFSALITVGEKEQVMSVPNSALSINKHTVQIIANQMGYTYQPLRSKMMSPTDNAKTVWVLRNKAFIETAVTVGISDADFVEITNGLNGSEDILYEIHETDSVQQLLSKCCTKEAAKE